MESNPGIFTSRASPPSMRRITFFLPILPTEFRCSTVTATTSAAGGRRNSMSMAPVGLPSTGLAGCWWPTPTFIACLSTPPDGQILFQLGEGVQGTTPGRFGYPTDVEIDSAGNFYVAEYGENDRIQVFSPEGEWLRQWGGHGYELGEFLKPRALAIDEHDRLFVADSCNHRIQVFDTQGKLLNSWGSRGDRLGQMSYPYDLAIGPDGCLYVCEYGNHRVQKFTLDGKPLAVWGTAGRGPGQLFNPYALAVDSRCNISVVDSNNHRVQRFRL